MDKASTKEYKVGDKIWWHHGDLFIRCTVTRVDDQYRKKDPENGILFYEIDEPVGHSLGDGELSETLEGAFGSPEDWESEDVEGYEPTLDSVRRNTVRFILSTQTDVSAHYCKIEKVTDLAVEKALVDWGYPPKKRGEDWLTFEEALEKIKKK